MAAWDALTPQERARQWAEYLKEKGINETGEHVRKRNAGAMNETGDRTDRPDRRDPPADE